MFEGAEVVFGERYGFSDTLVAFLLFNPEKDFEIRFKINCSISENPKLDSNPNNLLRDVDFLDSIINQIAIFPFLLHCWSFSDLIRSASWDLRPPRGWTACHSG